MISVFLAAGVRLYRDGLAAALSAEETITVVGTAADRAETLAQVRALGPDILLLDMSMPESVRVVREITAARPEPKVVVLAVPESEQQVVDFAEAGVSGYLTRDASLADVVATVESVARGETICSPRIAATLLRRVTTLAARVPPGPGARLTTREREVLALIDEGLSNKEIARHLCIEVATVKNHVHHILDKLEVKGRAEAARIGRVQAGTAPTT